MEKVENIRPLTLVPRTAGLSARELRWVEQAFSVLHVALIALPIVAGIDKFTRVLVDWRQYLAAPLGRLFGEELLLLGAGGIEVALGLLVAFKPSVGGWALAAWLWLIVANLLLAGGFLDIALRDLALSLGAVAVARLGALVEAREPPV